MSQRILIMGLPGSGKKYNGSFPSNNQDLATVLKIELPPNKYFQDYNKSDIGIKVIWVIKEVGK